MDEDLYNRAKAAFEEGSIEETLDILKNNVSDENINILFLKGEASYYLQNWGDSLNYFRKVLVINPENTKAKTYIDMIQNILSFYHTDFFNP